MTVPDNWTTVRLPGITDTQLEQPAWRDVPRRRCEVERQLSRLVEPDAVALPVGPRRLAKLWRLASGRVI